MASHTPPPTAEPEQATTPPPAGNRFFGWMRGLGIQRQPGWVGGVSAGLGLRLGIDPLIVRGIIVVIAVLGGPALLLYAAAWLLLPDTEDRIHAEELGRGRFAPPLIGIGVMVLLSLLPLNRGFWFLGAVYWGDLSLGASVGRMLWTALMLALIVVFVLVVARRAGRSAPIVVPATTDDKPDTVPIPVVPTPTGEAAEAAAGAATEAADATAPADAQASAAASVALVAPVPPPAPGGDASAEELAAWRERQALWKQQHEEWKTQQAATELELRHQRALEAHERGLAATAERLERRRLARLANPRLGAAIGWAVLGLAIIVAGVTALVVDGDPQLAGHEATVALAAAALTVGVAIVAAGLFRRRSGALGFVAVLLVLGMLVSAAVPRDRVVLPPNVWRTADGEARLLVPAGPLNIMVAPDGAPGVTDIWQATGYTEIHVQEGASVRVEALINRGEAAFCTRDVRGNRSCSHFATPVGPGGDQVWRVVLGPDPDPSQTIRLEQINGYLAITDENPGVAAEELLKEILSNENEGAQP